MKAKIIVKGKNQEHPLFKPTYTHEYEMDVPIIYIHGKATIESDGIFTRPIKTKG